MIRLSAGRGLPWRVGRQLASLCAVAVAVGVARSDAASVTNNVIGVKLTEKLSRKVKFVHAGPFLGHWAEFADKGSWSLSFTLPMDGVDPTKFTSQSFLWVIVNTPASRNHIVVSLADDPKYKTGATKAKIVQTAQVNGKEVKLMTISLKFSLTTFSLDVKIKGQYQNNQRSDGLPNPIGNTLLAGVMLGQPTGGFQDNALVSAELIDASTQESAVGTAVVEFAGAVVTKPVTDAEIGTFNTSTVVLGGISTP